MKGLSQDLSDLRTERRIPLRMQLQFDGITSSGQNLHTHITTFNLSRSGLCFRTDRSFKLKPGELIEGTLKGDRFNTACKVRIVWSNENCYGGYVGDSAGIWPLM